MEASPTVFNPVEENAIGVVGGMGPYAGFDLVRGIFDETVAATDQEHLPVALLSYPGRIPDRSQWLADPRSVPSPVPGMLSVLRRLEDAGCAVAGIPCNTAHAPAIFDLLRAELEREGRRIRLVHMIDAIVSHIAELAPNAKRIGVLATSSSVENRLHHLGLAAAGLDSVRPDTPSQELVQASIFEPSWGLKSQSNPPSDRAREVLLSASDILIERGADAVILGCTELPLAIPDRDRHGVPFINSTLALARALIREAHPGKLRPVRR